MRGILFMLLVGMMALEAGEGWSRRGRYPHPRPNEPWMGVKFGRMDKVTQAQLKDVPKGFGLIVETIDEGSPAEEAGLRELDILWKLDDQLVANQQQLYFLLLHKGLDAEVTVTVSREGSNMEVPMVLKPRPEPFEVSPDVANEMIIPGIPDITRKVVYDRRTAFVQVGDETVSLSRTDGGFRYAVMKGKTLLKKGRLEGDDPEDWKDGVEADLRDSLVALAESLINAEERDREPPRLPRVRRVPSAGEVSTSR